MVGRCSEKNDKRHIQTQNPIPIHLLMAFLGVFVFTGISGEYIGLEDNINDYYEETNLADGWIYSPYLNDCFWNKLII